MSERKKARVDPALELAKGVLLWEAQWGPTDPADTDSCGVDPEDWLEWVEYARAIRAAAGLDDCGARPRPAKVAR